MKPIWRARKPSGDSSPLSGILYCAKDSQRTINFDSQTLFAEKPDHAIGFQNRYPQLEDSPAKSSENDGGFESHRKQVVASSRVNVVAIIHLLTSTGETFSMISVCESPEIRNPN